MKRNILKNLNKTKKKKQQKKQKQKKKKTTEHLIEFCEVIYHKNLSVLHKILIFAHRFTISDLRGVEITQGFKLSYSYIYFYCYKKKQPQKQ